MDYLFDMPTDFKVYKIKRDKSSGSQPAHTHPYYEIFYLIMVTVHFLLTIIFIS